MPSVMHDGFLQPFADRPALAAELLVQTLGLKLPAGWQARALSADLTQLVPTQFLADLVVVASGTDVLSALTHGDGHPQRHRVLSAILTAVRTLATIDPERAAIYHDIVNAALPEAARLYLERLMSTKTYQFKSEWHVSRINRGRVQGRAEAVLAVLAARGVEVPDEARQRILDCTDLDQLDRWVQHASVADSIRDLPLD